MHSQGEDLNAKDKNGSTALRVAAASGHLETVKYLVEIGKVNIHTQDSGRMPLFLLAAANGQTEVVAWLFLQETEQETRNRDSARALFLAVYGEHLATVKYLIETAKADIHHQDRYGDTVLSVAARKGYLNIVQYLHAHDGSLNHRNSDGETPLLLAAKNGQTEMVTWLLLQGAELVVKDENEFTAVLHQFDEKGNVPLHYAVKFCTPAQLQLLLKETDVRKDINRKNLMGTTPLHFAVLRQDQDSKGIVTCLLDNGADACCANNKG